MKNKIILGSANFNQIYGITKNFIKKKEIKRSFNFLFSLKVNLGFFVTLLSLNDFPLYLFDIN